MVEFRVKVWDRLKTKISKTTCNLWSQRQMLIPIRHSRPQCPSKTKSYLKVTALTVTTSSPDIHRHGWAGQCIGVVPLPSAVLVRDEKLTSPAATAQQTQTDRRVDHESGVEGSNG